MNVPIVMNYATALGIYEKTKPIRGRSPELRPLGDRRDCDTYSIRKREDDIELVLYKTPVITFKPDGEVVLFTNGYDTVSTRQFIYRVLGIRANGVQRHTVLTINGDRLVLGDDEKLRLKRENGNWCALNPTTMYGWKLNRKATANVRAKYADFYKYLKGFVSLRSEVLKESYWFREQACVIVPRDEFASLFSSLVSMRAYCYMDKRGNQHVQWSRVSRDQYNDSATKFMSLIDPDQTEEDKHTNFYKAALLLIAKEDVDTMDIRADQTVVESKKIVPKLDEILFQFYAHDVLTREPMAQGKVSSGRYDKWMTEW